ncbi:lipid II flippase MurJ, partial [Bittarella massiliensis (ex Durand et al. 2017)]
FADSVTYLTIIFVGFLFIFLANISGSLFNALGDSKTPLYCMAAGGLLNIVLNLWFVIGFGWGVFGVALATVIGQVFTCTIGFPLLMRRIARLGDGQ